MGIERGNIGQNVYGMPGPDWEWAVALEPERAGKVLIYSPSLGRPVEVRARQPDTGGFGFAVALRHKPSAAEHAVLAKAFEDYIDATA